MQQQNSYNAAVNFLKQSDPVLGELITQIGTCQLANTHQQTDLFAALARAILYQQLSTKAAATIHNRFLQLYPDLPSAAAVLNTPEVVLRSVGVSRPKIRYLKDLANQVLSELPSLEQLSVMDDEAIILTLTQVKGVGRWTVQMLLIFHLHRLDVLPLDDLGVRAGIRKVYGLDQLPSKQLIASLGQNWQPYRSVAAWYLWQSLSTN